MKYDIIIIGGGPAGVCAAIYALRANKKVLLLEKEVIGGKIVSSPLIENYPGFTEIKGAELSEQLYHQLTELGGEIQFEEVIAIENGEKKKVLTKNKIWESGAVIIATGTKYRTLGLKNEEKYIGRGISFCAVCDGFFYKNKVAAVVGGGNTAVANALELSNICKKVYIIQVLEKLTAEAILIKKLQEKENVEILYGTVAKEWVGEDRLKGVRIENKEGEKILEIEGAFLAIGQIPETKWISKENIVMNEQEYIHINKEGMTNQEGIFAAGDCVDKKIRQLTTAVSDGTIAALNAVEYIENK